MGARHAFRIGVLLLIGLMPGPIKRACYRRAFGYRVGRDVRLGVSLFDCRALTIEDGARVGHGNAFVACGEVLIGRKARVGSFNLFRGGSRIALGAYTQVIRMNVVNAIVGHDCHGAPDSTFLLEFGGVLTNEHRVDFTDRVRVGRCAMLAGRGSTIWTHNRRQSRPVDIGAFAYVGSESKFAPGASVADCTIVGLGSVLMTSFDDPGVLVAGAPARAVRPLGPADAETIFGPTREDLPPQEYPWAAIGMNGPPPSGPGQTTPHAADGAA